MADLLRSAGAAFTNLETLFHDFEGPAMPAMPALRSDPKLAKELAWAGFRLCSRANNHAGDYGVDGMRATTKHVADAGILQAGVGENLEQARRAAVFRGPAATISLVAATSTFSPELRAGNPAGRIPGRPGVNPLRFQTTYRLPARDLEAVRSAARALRLDPPPDGDFDFGGLRLAPGEEARVATEPDASDVSQMAAEVRRAKAETGGLVIVSIHCHEGAGGLGAPPDFLAAFAHAMIDAGADAVVGHGPHVLRGIEIHRGKPIFYSLGNFAFEYETVSELPADDDEAVGLPPGAPPGDFFDAYDRSGTRGYPADAEAWESVVAVLRWRGAELAGIELYPISLGFGLPRVRRGCPRRAGPELSKKILDRLSRLSAPFGTRIDAADGVGRVSIPSTATPPPS